MVLSLQNTHINNFAILSEKPPDKKRYSWKKLMDWESAINKIVC